jgi:hypothetical protein
MWIHSKWLNLLTLILDGAHNRALVPKMIFPKILDQAMYIAMKELALPCKVRGANNLKECKMGCCWLNLKKKIYRVDLYYNWL